MTFISQLQKSAFVGADFVTSSRNKDILCSIEQPLTLIKGMLRSHARFADNTAVEERIMLRQETDGLRRVTIGPMQLKGILSVPEAARSFVIFAHGSGRSRLSLRNTYVAERLQKHGMATLCLIS